MGPPQVDLNQKQKQPLEDVTGWAEKVGPHKLPPLSPPTLPPIGFVSVETGTQVGAKSGCGKSRCKTLIVGIVIGVVVALASAVCGFLIVRGIRQHRMSPDYDLHYADVDVRMEDSRRLIYFARDKSPNETPLLAVLDYNSQLAGFKDLDRQRCYVDRLRESYEDGCSRYRDNSRTPQPRPMRVMDPDISPAVLGYIVGEPIYNMCADVPSYWVVEADLLDDNSVEGGSEYDDSNESKGTPEDDGKPEGFGGSEDGDDTGDDIVYL